MKMPIANIIDRRTNKYNVDVLAIFEPSCHDNITQGATAFEYLKEEDCDTHYDEIPATTISNAIEYAQKWSYPMTLFLYDVGSNFDT